MQARLLPMGRGALLVEVPTPTRPSPCAPTWTRSSSSPKASGRPSTTSCSAPASLLVVLREPTRARRGRPGLPRGCPARRRHRPTGERRRRRGRGALRRTRPRRGGAADRPVAGRGGAGAHQHARGGSASAVSRRASPTSSVVTPGWRYRAGPSPVPPFRPDPSLSQASSAASTRTPRPGGWQLLGTTDAVLWDVDRDPPSLLAPGRSVRFVAVDAPALSSGPVVPVVQPARDERGPWSEQAASTGQVSVASRSLPPVRSRSSRTPAVLAWPAWEWGVPARPTPRHTCSACASWGTCSTWTTHPSAPRRPRRSRSRSEACRSVPTATCSSH